MSSIFGVSTDYLLKDSLGGAGDIGEMPEGSTAELGTGEKHIQMIPLWKLQIFIWSF